MIVTATHLDSEIASGDFANPAWNSAGTVSIEQYWSGESAEPSRHFVVRALWSNETLQLQFDCRQSEPLIVSTEPKLDSKTIGLWERDVCEAFIRPGPGTRDREPGKDNRYFEFEAAPTGEWLDLAIEPTADGRITDWDYASGMSVAGRVESGRVLIAMRIPWKAFGGAPKPGDRWRANFFRCVGDGESRGYLAWQPTLTPKPNFHVPERFGELVFAA
jgi:hypothetical protein